MHAALTADAVLFLLDTSSAEPILGLVGPDGIVLGRATLSDGRGLSERLPAAADAVLAAGPPPDAVGCVVGPGSFTGCRAGLAFGHGFALGAGIPLIGVSVGEAIRAAAGETAGAVTWVATGAGEGRVFLDRDGAVAAFDLDALPGASDRRIRIAGDAARAVARHLGITDCADARPTFAGIAAAVRARIAGSLPPREPLPLYVDPPRTSEPGRGVSRPPPSP